MTKPMNVLYVVTEYGHVEVREHELASITDGQLYNLGMSREDLHRCFAEGVLTIDPRHPLTRGEAVMTQPIVRGRPHRNHVELRSRNARPAMQNVADYNEMKRVLRLKPLREINKMTASLTAMFHHHVPRRRTVMTTPAPTTTTPVPSSAEPTLTDYAQRINERLKAMADAMVDGIRNSVTCAFEAGELLRRVKAKVPHGAWKKWLKKNCDLKERTAQRYMKLAENRKAIEEKLKGENATVADLTVRRAERLITDQSNEQRRPNKQANSDDDATDNDAAKASDYVDKLVERLLKALEMLSKERDEETAKAAAAGIVQRLQTARYLEKKKAA